MTDDAPDTRGPFAHCVNLALPRLGAEVVSASDEFFAPRDRLIKPEPPEFIPGRYDDHGKWMDGWETRRRREAGHDHCIIRLGFPAAVAGFDVDTSYFTGNYPPEVAIDAASGSGTPSDSQWREIVPRQPIDGDTHNLIELAQPACCNHLRLRIYPDGGIARLRVYGCADPDWSALSDEDEIDLAAIENGGVALDCNDCHYGDPVNMIAPDPPLNMGDGWETRRRRTPGHDWAVIGLGHAGTVTRLEIGTRYFKGNYPDRCSVEGALVDSETHAPEWQTLLPDTRLGPDAVHVFADEIRNHGPVNQVRLNIFPDGGISRLRVYGQPTRGGA